MKLFTVGYGGRNPEQFLALLRPHGVRTVVDVRLRPDRASMGVWVKAKDDARGIRKWLAGAGIGYLSLPELGNMFLEYPDWPARYERFMETAGHLLLDRLGGVSEPYCLMCAEKRVVECHRRTIAEYLVRHRGAEVEHLE